MRLCARVGLLTAMLCALDIAPGTAQDAAVEHAEAADPNVERIRALTEGQLDTSVEPDDLFDVPLADEQAIALQAARIRLLLRAAEGDAEVAQGRLDGGVWRARLELDRARLRFYELPTEQRSELLDAHRARREAAHPRESELARVAREAEQERQRALVAAEAAHSEAERLLAEELARLLGIQNQLTARERLATEERGALRNRVDRILGWQRRIRDAKAASGDDADATYDALRASLRSSRDQLDAALDALNAELADLPVLGPDPLQSLPVELDARAVRARRASVERQLADTHEQALALREQRASTLLEETSVLNRERLGLLAYLSANKRAAITSFSAAGADQARSEARQLLLILRYHRHVAGRWLAGLRANQRIEGVSTFQLVLSTLPWLLTLGLFVWWRRQSTGWLDEAERRAAAEDRIARRTTPSLLRQLIGFVRGIHRPLEGLVLFWTALWLLPEGAQQLLETQLLTVVIGWLLGAALIVNALNALVALSERGRAAQQDGTDELRLRSLRLVGRVVVGFALVLLLTSRLVGRGTVYDWVLSTCWFAALPVFLVLVRWWRDTVFARLERVRRKSPLQEWLLANREGWKSFLAATLAAGQLFASGALKIVGSWLAGFTLTRRADAYLFKRELDRLGSTDAQGTRLAGAAYDSLSPDRAGTHWITCPADELVASLGQRIGTERPGIVAVVAARGMGRSSLLRQLHAKLGDGWALACRDGAPEPALRARAGSPRWVSLDDVDVLIKPVMGGLGGFEAFADAIASGFAEPRFARTLWVLTIDSAIWPFLYRSHDGSPLFEQVWKLSPWSDQQLGSLLAERSREASFEATFDALLDKLPPGADEIDRQEALREKRAGYTRVIWDYARGNPAIALEVWRNSLLYDAASELVRARPLQVPNTSTLEQLPDPALFVLRAILQMAPASSTDVAEATRLSEAQVRDVFQAGRSTGYLVDARGGVDVTWTWLRAVTLVLERRHLLVSS
ncbi:MAG TPA: hypothetical protein VFX59_11690 [Polyangiales bacterium]|nr:hypothetical protein [Polyangiales bacterium]